VEASGKLLHSQWRPRLHFLPGLLHLALATPSNEISVCEPRRSLTLSNLTLSNLTLSNLTLSSSSLRPNTSPCSLPSLPSPS